MMIELIGTWMIIGFFSAIGWGAADKAVVEPYVKPAISKAMDQPEPAKIEAPNSNNK